MPTEYRVLHCFPRFCLQSMAPFKWVNQLPLAVPISPVSGPAARMLSLTSAAAGVNMDGDASMPATCRFSSAARRSSLRCTLASCWASLGALLGLGKAGSGAPKPGGSRHGRSTCAARLPIALWLSRAASNMKVQYVPQFWKSQQTDPTSTGNTFGLTACDQNN